MRFPDSKDKAVSLRGDDEQRTIRLIEIMRNIDK